MAKIPKPRFNLKRPRSKTESLIFLIYRYRGQKLRYSTRITISVKDWDFKAQRPIEQERRPDLWAIRRQLDDLGKTVEGKSLNNGQSHRIKGFTQDGHIQLENGQTLSRDYGNFTLGYYRTSHSSQGKDADDVLIAQSSISFPASNEKQFYVSASRGIERCFIYTDDKEALKWAAIQDANRMSAAEIAEVCRDQSLWLAARRAMKEQYPEVMEPNYDYETTKEQTYGTAKESLEREFSAEADRSGGHEPGL